MFNYATNQDRPIFSLVEWSEAKERMVHQVTVSMMNNNRSFTSKQKTRSEVRGGGRKPWKQKGTGRARAGTIRSPIWRTGGRAFPNLGFGAKDKINKKVYWNAFAAILNKLYTDGKCKVIEDFTLSSISTKQVLESLKASNLEFARRLVVVDKDISLEKLKSFANLKNFSLVEVAKVNCLLLANVGDLVFTETSVDFLHEHLKEKLERRVR